MYCPKCSQQQVSDEMRFCSRCGFSLSGVRELIASASAPVEPAAEPQTSQLLRRQRGVRRGAWMMLASLALALVVGLLAAIDDVFAVFLLVPILCFVIGFARVLYGALIAEKRAARRKLAASQPQVIPLMSGQSGTDAHRPQLYPPRVAPTESFTPQRINTAEMVQPPSVIEGTTRLLDEEAGRHRE
ncbi:MAG: zinc ribbon domain-containing protein [Acidobacteriota bacterium]